MAGMKTVKKSMKGRACVCAVIDPQRSETFQQQLPTVSQEFLTLEVHFKPTYFLLVTFKLIPKLFVLF